MQYFLNTLYTKTRPSNGLLFDMELLKKCFLKCQQSVNIFFQISTKYRMTYFNISIVVKHRKDNYK